MPDAQADMQLPPAVRQWFLDAGWYPGRCVRVPRAVPRGHPAHAVLAAFGGLILPEREPEAGWPVIEELVFAALTRDPTITGVWGRLLRSTLVGIARVHSDHAELYMDATGRCFGRSLMHDAFYYHGASFEETIEGFYEGRRSRPMLRPGQSSVTLYGLRFTAESPELYRYG